MSEDRSPREIPAIVGATGTGAVGFQPEVEVPRYSWIVFDADNTLFDFDRAEHGALERSLGSFGVRCDDGVRARYAAISARLWRELEGGRIDSGRLRVARFEELLAERDPHVDPRHVSAAFLRELGGASDLLAESETVVRRLVRSHRLLLATNGFADVQRRRLEASTIADCFHDVLISDEIGVGKPRAEFFDEAFRRMGMPAKRDVLMVGDSLTSDIAGGSAYGLDTCWLRPRTAATPHDRAIRCDPVAGERSPTYSIGDLTELLAIVA